MICGHRIGIERGFSLTSILTEMVLVLKVLASYVSCANESGVSESCVCESFVVIVWNVEQDSLAIVMM